MKSIGDLFNSTTVKLDDVKQLVDKGADLLERNNYGDTLLTRAVDTGHLEIARFFISKNIIDINAKNKFGKTALFCAGYRGYDTIIPDLLAAGSDINAVNNMGQTALMATTLLNNISTAKILLKTGADVDIKDNQGRTLLMKAVYSRQPEIVKLAIQAKAKDLQDKKGRTALMIAFKTRIDDNPDLDLLIIKMLIKHNVNINATDEHGETPLMAAVLAHNVDGVSVLLDAGAALDIKNDMRQTALDIAIDKNTWYPNPVYKTIIEKIEYYNKTRVAKTGDKSYGHFELNI